jgi:hypothetical protein
MSNSDLADLSQLPVSKTVRLFGDNHPTDNSGTKLPGFSFQQVYQVEKGNIESVIYKIYKEVFDAVLSQNDSSTKLLLIKYLKENLGSQDESLYITVHHLTPRSVEAKIFMRFFRQNDSLNLDINSYVLGQANRNQMLWRLILSWTSCALFFMSILPSVSLLLMNGYLSDPVNNIAGSAAIFLILLVICWFPVLPRIANGSSQSISLTIRQIFPCPANQIQSPDANDVAIFLKYTLTKAISIMKRTFEHENLPTDGLNRAAQNIEINDIV